MRVAGPVGSLPAGEPVVSALVEHRSESIGDAYSFPNATIVQLIPSRSQTVDSVYAEAVVPLFSQRNSISGVEELELQVSGRKDWYTVNGASGIVIQGAPIATVTYKVSSPNPTVRLRSRHA